MGDAVYRLALGKTNPPEKPLILFSPGSLDTFLNSTIPSRGTYTSLVDQIVSLPLAGGTKHDTSFEVRRRCYDYLPHRCTFDFFYVSLSTPSPRRSDTQKE